MTAKSRLGRIVENYIIKYEDALQAGAMKKAALARMIAKDYPEDVTSIENVRNMIRAKTGSKIRNDGRTNTVIVTSKAEHSSPLPIPKSEAKPIPNYVIKEEGTWLIFSDVHIPYHDEEALKVMLSYALEQDIKGIIINGDLVDNYKASKFIKDHTKPDLKYEYDMVRQWLKDLKELFKCRIIWKFGNHDERLALNIMQNVPQLCVYINTFIETIFNLEEIGIELVKSSQIIELGKLMVLHGHEFPGGSYSPVNAARGLFNKAKCSAIIGHHHQTSSHSEGNLKYDRIATYSLGCLCDMQPEYYPTAHTKWNHGFALVDLESDGTYTVHNKQIVKGKVR